MTNNVIPTVLSHDLKDFKEKLKKLKKISKFIHIDIMDGKFTGRKSPDIRGLKIDKAHFYEAHVMAFKPYNYFYELKKIGIKKIIFHLEACTDSEAYKAIKLAAKLNLDLFVAINPGTGIRKYADFIGRVDGILLMGVRPGKEGQEIDKRIYGRILGLRKMDKKIIIQIDGGVRSDNARKLIISGANILNTGSFVSNSENPEKALSLLKEKIRKAK